MASPDTIATSHVDGSTDMLDRLAARARQLYTLPTVAAKVLELTQSPTVDIPALREAIEHDPALCGKILKVVNSSLFGLSRSVTDLSQALALLGVKPLKMLTLGFSLPPALTRDVSAETLARYWRRSLVKSVAAREIAVRLLRVGGEEAFLAGLFHDVGVLALVQDLGDSYAKFYEHVMADASELERLEHDNLGFEHSALSARMLDSWRLAPTLVAAVARGNSLADVSQAPAAERPLGQALHLAELVCRTLVDGRSGAMRDLLAAGRAVCGMDEARLDELIASLESPLEQVADVMSVSLGDDGDCRKLLERARQRLVEEAEGLAMEMARPEDRLLDDIASLRDAARSATAGRFASPRPAPAPEEPKPSPPSTTVILEQTLQVAANDCRQRRRPLSLLVASVDRWSDHAFARGPRGLTTLQRVVESILTQAVPDASAVLIADGVFAVVAAGLDRLAAVDVAKRCCHAVRQWSEATAAGTAEGAAGPPAATLSIGVASVALAPRNFPPKTLIDSARRCSQAQQTAGGDGAKSIEIY